MTYRVRPGRSDEAEALHLIEDAAGMAFATVGYPEIAAAESTDVAILRAAAVAGSLYVLADVADRAAGFMLCAELDDSVYVQELAVHPDHAGRRLAVPLLAAAEARARRLGLGRLLLTTFRRVPWNAPYYTRLGFTALAPAGIGAGLRHEIERQQALGLDITDRVAMQRSIA